MKPFNNCKVLVDFPRACDEGGGKAALMGAPVKYTE